MRRSWWQSGDTTRWRLQRSDQMCNWKAETSSKTEDDIDPKPRASNYKRFRGLFVASYRAGDRRLDPRIRYHDDASTCAWDSIKADENPLKCLTMYAWTLLWDAFTQSQISRCDCHYLLTRVMEGYIAVYAIHSSFEVLDMHARPFVGMPRRNHSTHLKTIFFQFIVRLRSTSWFVPSDRTLRQWMMGDWVSTFPSHDDQLEWRIRRAPTASVSIHNTRAEKGRKRTW